VLSIIFASETVIDEIFISLEL